MRNLQTKQHRFIDLPTIAVWVVGWLSIKFVLPAFPKMVIALNASQAELKYSIILFLLCYAITQPFWGSWSERSGRKSVLLVSLSLMSLGSLIIIFAHSMTLYFIGRSLEGLAAGAISPICRAIYSDRYHKKQELGRKLAIMAAVVSIMPAIGPLLAGFLVSDLGWRAPFVAFFIAGLLAMIIFTLAFKETKNRQDKPSVKNMLLHYKEVFANRRFCFTAIAYSFLTGALISYYAATAFWFVFQYHIKESVFSYFLLITAVVYVASALTGRELLKHWPSEKLFKAGLKLALFSAALLLIAAAVFHGSVIFIIAASSFFAITAGLMSPCINSEIMSIFQHIAGPASAILTLTFFTFSSLLSVVTMNLNAQSSWQVGGFFAGCFVVASVLGWLSNR